MSDFIELTKLKGLLDRVVQNVTDLRTQTSSWNAVTDKVKQYHGQIVDDQLCLKIPTFSTPLFQDIMSDDTPPTLKSLFQLPDALKLDIQVLKKHFMVYILVVVDQDDQYDFYLYTGSCTAYALGAYGRIAQYRSMMSSILTYDEALLEILVQDLESDDVVEASESDAAVEVSNSDETVTFPTLHTAGIHLKEVLKAGYRIKHLGVAFMIEKVEPDDPVRKLLKAYTLILECIVMHGLWSVWCGPTSRDHDTLLLRHLCPWDVKDLGYDGLNGHIPLWEQVDAPDDGLTRHQRSEAKLRLVRELLEKGQISESDPRVADLRRRIKQKEESNNRYSKKWKAIRKRIRDGDVGIPDQDVQYVEKRNATRRDGKRERTDRMKAALKALEDGDLEESDSEVEWASNTQVTRRGYGETHRNKWKSGRARLARNDPSATESDAEVKAWRTEQRSRKTTEEKRLAKQKAKKLAKNPKNPKNPKKQEKQEKQEEQEEQAENEKGLDKRVLAPLPNPPAGKRLKSGSDRKSI